MTSTVETIKAFLSLPSESLPAADWLDSMGEQGSAWGHLRDYIRPAAKQRVNHMGETIRLKADREGWQAGVIVTLG